MGQHYVRSASPGPLGSAVGSLLGYEITDDSPTVHRGLPSPWLTFVISLDGPVPTATGPGPDAPLHRYASLVGGLHTTPAYIHQPVHQEGVQLALDPLASRALLGLPAGELGLVTDADDVLGPLSRDLRERLGETSAWQLTSLFSAELGLSPGAACRLARFDEAQDAVRARSLTPSGPNLAAVAARTCYADHSHLVRDFQAFAGLSPTAWVAQERANIQAVGGSSRAG